MGFRPRRPGSHDDLPRQHHHEEREEEIPEDALQHHRVLGEPHRVQPVGGPARQRREAEVEALAPRGRDGAVARAEGEKEDAVVHGLHGYG